jgi:hypothetical protein
MKEPKGRLAVNSEGLLAETNELDITKIDKLAKLEGEVQEGRIVLQPLPQKEKIIGGIILPGVLGEFRCAVITSYPNSKFKRGDVVALKLSDFPGGMPPQVDFLEGVPCTILFESFIWYKYAYRIEDESAI